jgi:Putative prokaryotic signal transducing protein
MSAQPIADPGPEPVEVFDTMQESEAMIVHGLLTSAGIDSVIATLQATQDIFPGVGGISIRVNPAQEKEALRVIEDYRANPASEDDSALSDDNAAETK